jgi:hypothetical protein
VTGKARWFWPLAIALLVADMGITFGAILFDGCAGPLGWKRQGIEVVAD